MLSLHHKLFQYFDEKDKPYHNLSSFSLDFLTKWWLYFYSGDLDYFNQLAGLDQYDEIHLCTEAKHVLHISQSLIG